MNDNNIAIEEIQDLKGLLKKAEYTLINARKEKPKDSLLISTNQKKFFVVIENLDYPVLVKTVQALEAFQIQKPTIHSDSNILVEQYKLKEALIQPFNFNLNVQIQQKQKMQEEKIEEKRPIMPSTAKLPTYSYEINHNNSKKVKELIDFDELALKNEKEIREFRNLYEQAQKYDSSVKQVMQEQNAQKKTSFVENFSNTLSSVVAKIKAQNTSKKALETIDKEKTKVQQIIHKEEKAVHASKMIHVQVPINQSKNIADQQKTSVQKEVIQEVEKEQVKLVQQTEERPTSIIVEKKIVRPEITDEDYLKIAEKIKSLSDGELLNIAMENDFKLYTDLGEGRIDADEFRERVRRLARELEIKKLKQLKGIS
ncbi:MAG: hypothetical protein QXO21_01675 [Candidatus Anstonellales archaeon]